MVEPDIPPRRRRRWRAGLAATPGCALDNDGIAKIVTISPPRTVTSVQLNITLVSSSTSSVGLAEMEAYAAAGP